MYKTFINNSSNFIYKKINKVDKLMALKKYLKLNLPIKKSNIYHSILIYIKQSKYIEINI
jgi:hypothetical protein